MSKITKEDIKEKAEDLFKQYWRYSAYLRNWFIGYGVGALILFVNNQNFFASMNATCRNVIFICIFLAIFAQVIVTIINKYSQYYLYLGKLDYLEGKNKDKILKRSFNISNCVWIDRLADYLTMFCYLVATIIIFMVLINK